MSGFRTFRVLALLAVVGLVCLASCGKEGGGYADSAADDDAGDDDVGDDDTVTPTYGYALWPDETGPDVLAEWYPFFAEMKSELYVEVLEEWIFSRDPGVARIFREAHAAGVHVRPYIILPTEDGVYPNEANFEQFFDDVKAFIAWVEEENLPVEWIGVDMETPVQMVLELESYIREFKFLEAFLVLLDHRNPEMFEQSVANYQELVDYCHAHGFNVHVISFPFVLDDYNDEDFHVQDAFDVPVSGVEWDELDFMVYRTMYQDYTLMPFTSDLVYRYALMANKVFGERASVFIGLVLWPGWFDGDNGYQDPAELEADIEAALAGGVRRIHIFYLTGLLAKDDPLAWMSPDVSDYEAPRQDPFTTLFVDTAMPLFDMLL